MKLNFLSNLKSPVKQKSFKGALHKFSDLSFLLRWAMWQIRNLNCAPVKLKDICADDDQRITKVVTLNQLESRHLKLTCFVHSMATCFQLIQCFILKPKTPLSQFDNILGWFSVITATISTLYLHINRCKGIA